MDILINIFYMKTSAASNSTEHFLYNKKQILI